LIFFQFILVIAGTLITWLGQLKDNHNIDVVGDVPSG
jgi:hypothetical protein